MKKILIGFIKFYQLLPRRRRCVFYPSCSEYTLQALASGGVWYGVKRGVFRILSCHPWQRKFFDPFQS